jgi:hypothetical protein
MHEENKASKRQNTSRNMDKGGVDTYGNSIPQNP